MTKRSLEGDNNPGNQTRKAKKEPDNKVISVILALKTAMEEQTKKGLGDRDYTQIQEILRDNEDIVKKKYLEKNIIHDHFLSCEIAKALGLPAGQSDYLESPLALAIYLGDLDIVKFLVEQWKANVNQPLYWHASPMVLAAKSTEPNSLEIFKYLHSQGGKLDIKYLELFSLVSEASKAGNKGIVDFLAEKGVVPKEAFDYITTVGSGDPEVALYIMKVPQLGEIEDGS